MEGLVIPLCIEFGENWIKIEFREDLFKTEFGENLTRQNIGTQNKYFHLTANR
jgi:hypothetical protein